MTKTLVVVDVQNDFCEGGSLAVAGGTGIAAAVRDVIAGDAYDVVVATEDHHVDPGSHFSDEPDFVDSWPRHCVVGTPGAELKAPLDESMFAAVFRKGQYDAGYSGFGGVTDDGTPLGDWLRDVFGLARNPYDGIGHLAQGFVPAIAARELLLRLTPLRPGRWLVTDDGLVVLRTVRNLLAGNGPVFNIGERVEANTSVLWQYLITAFGWLTGARLEDVAMWLALACTVIGARVLGRMWRITIRHIGEPAAIAAST